ncbi:MAG: hypothetical protein LIV24_08545 [Eubacterium sp.]|nr:hypothetical protein [Eubacterium sp.]
MIHGDEREKQDRCGRREILRRRLRTGSLTVEAAWAVPLFFLCVTSLICMMNIYGLYVKNLIRLQEMAEKAGAAQGIAGLQTDPVIDLCVPYFYKPEWFPVPIPGKRVAVRGRVHAWTGRDLQENQNVPSAKENRLVYMTEYGSVYHTHSGCTYLELKIQRVPAVLVSSLRNTGGGKYHACEKCVGKGGMHTLVYITEEGARYHNSVRCSGLTRKVRLIPVSEAEGKHICSRCAASGVAEERRAG